MSRVLVADDDATTRRLLRARLERLGHVALLAGDGDEALALARDERPDVAFVDRRMPGLDGLALTRRLRADAELASLPVVLLTARADPGDVAAGLAAGADAVLAKPVDGAELRARIEDALHRTGPTGEPAPPLGHAALADVDPETRDRLVGQFLATTAERVEHVRAARAAGDAPRLRELAHALKGAAAMYGATELSDAAAALEAHAAAGDGDARTAVERTVRAAAALPRAP